MFYYLTKDKHLWLTLLFDMGDHLPFPPAWCTEFGRVSQEILTSFSEEDLEAAARSVHVTDTKWLNTKGPPRKLLAQLDIGPGFNFSSSITGDPTSRTLLALEIFLDRWILVVYHEAIEVWDLYPCSSEDSVGLPQTKWDERSGPVIRCISERSLKVDYVTSYASMFDAEKKRIIVCLANADESHVVQLNLPPKSFELGKRVEPILSFRTPNRAQLVRTFDPSGTQLLYSHLQSLFLVELNTQRTYAISTGEGEEELWSSVVGVKYMTPNHIICLKTRSVELITLSWKSAHSNDSQGGNQIHEARTFHSHSLEHTFKETTFRGVSFSKPYVRLEQSEEGLTACVSISFLAYDVLRGLFHYRVNARIPHSAHGNEVESSIPFSLDVDMIAAHHMAESIQRPIDPFAIERSETPTPRSGFGPGSRGFVSTCSLGPSAMRGIWVERQRNSVKRTIFGFKTLLDANHHLIADSLESRETLAEHRAIDGKCVYTVQSYDLRDDITHCALSEVTGRIVIGTRNGDVLVL
ncbi:hypothetical protein C8Q75DRAFT_366786 [Abortiporus biennis]|nr:hypothetical protein C8Q75DRAFT_366786 [Abortiporus biennis]